MRLIGHLPDEPTAKRFGDFLYIQGIQNQLDHDKPEGWGVWVADEDKLAEATTLLGEFRRNPLDSKYRPTEKIEALKAKEQRDAQAYQQKIRGRRHLFQPLTPYGFGPFTFVLIVGSLAVFAMSGFGLDSASIHRLFISEVFGTSLPEVRHGEIWRLLTPIFIHFSALHIIFNMLWLRDLGSMIEGRQNSLHLFLLVVAIGVCSNLAQLYFEKPPHSPIFGGMSGVVYGLLGYIWMRGKFDPGSGLFLHQSTVVMMLVWLFVCLFGLVGNIANGAHFAGLGLGMVWGYFSSLKYR
jgi:GlpG protein